MSCKLERLMKGNIDDQNTIVIQKHKPQQVVFFDYKAASFNVTTTTARFNHESLLFETSQNVSRIFKQNALKKLWFTAYTQSHTHTHTRTYVLRTHARSRIHAHTHAHTRTYVHTITHAHTHTHAHTRMHTHARTDIHTRMHTHAQTQTRAHIRTHTQTHAHKA